MRRIFLAVNAVVLVVATLPVDARLKRDPERVALPKYCERLNVDFERSPIKHPIQKSPVEHLLSKNVSWQSGRCVVEFNYAYDAVTYGDVYFPKDQEEVESDTTKFLKSEKGRTYLEKLWRRNLTPTIAKLGLPHGVTVILRYTPVQPDYPEIVLRFHGENI